MRFRSSSVLARRTALNCSPREHTGRASRKRTDSIDRANDSNFIERREAFLFRSTYEHGIRRASLRAAPRLQVRPASVRRSRWLRRPSSHPSTFGHQAQRPSVALGDLRADPPLPRWPLCSGPSQSGARTPLSLCVHRRGRSAAVRAPLKASPLCCDLGAYALSPPHLLSIPCWRATRTTGRRRGAPLRPLRSRVRGAASRGAGTSAEAAAARRSWRGGRWWGGQAPPPPPPPSRADSGGLRAGRLRTRAINHAGETWTRVQLGLGCLRLKRVRLGVYIQHNIMINNSKCNSHDSWLHDTSHAERLVI